MRRKRKGKPFFRMKVMQIKHYSDPETIERILGDKSRSVSVEVSSDNREVSDDTRGSKNKLILFIGDSEYVLKHMAENNIKVDLVVTSPPYYTMRDTIAYHTYDEYMRKMRAIFSNLRSVLRPGRFCIVNVCDYLVNGKRLTIGSDFIQMLKELGYVVHDDIIWAKPRGKAQGASKRAGIFIQSPYPLYYKPNNIYEHIIVSTNGEMTSYRKTDDKYRIDWKKYKDYMCDIWEIHPVDDKYGHPAPFPIQIPINCIEFYSFPGETVLDPFMGSGTTFLAARKLNRSCIGIEINRDYVEIIKKKVGWNTGLDYEFEIIDLGGE